MSGEYIGEVCSFIRRRAGRRPLASYLVKSYLRMLQEYSAEIGPTDKQVEKAGKLAERAGRLWQEHHS